MEENLKQGERIAKVMARAGLCSRREAEDWINQGRVSVNGKTLTSPACVVTTSDKITVDGKTLQEREATRLFAYHKRNDEVTTTKDPQGRKTIYESLPYNLPRLVSVGRLDLTTEGLILLTNDGELKRFLELPKNEIPRSYRVRAHGSITQMELDKLKSGFMVEDIQYGKIIALLDKADGANKWLTLTLFEGKNREIRKVLQALGLTVNRLIRTQFGPYHLGDLPKGAILEVDPEKARSACVSQPV